MTTRKIGAALVSAFGHKVMCDAALIKAYEAMKQGEAPYNPSKLASAVEKCDEAQAEFWRALRLEMKDRA